jgi:hypothetical protein
VSHGAKFRVQLCYFPLIVIRIIYLYLKLCVFILFLLKLNFYYEMKKETQLQTRNVFVSSMELVLIFRPWLLKRNRETYFH